MTCRHGWNSVCAHTCVRTCMCAHTHTCVCVCACNQMAFLMPRTKSIRSEKLHCLISVGDSMRILEGRDPGEDHCVGQLLTPPSAACSVLYCVVCGGHVTQPHRLGGLRYGHLPSHGLEAGSPRSVLGVWFPQRPLLASQVAVPSLAGHLLLCVCMS